MKSFFGLTVVGLVAMLFALSSCSVQDETPAKPAAPAAAAPAAKAPAKAEAKAAAAEKAPAKAKATKVAGDVGLLDVEKNYLILVTKEQLILSLIMENCK